MSEQTLLRNELVVHELIEALGPDKVLTGDQVSDRYEHIWKMDKPLMAMAVVVPRSSDDVSTIMQICSANNQAVVVHGGLTNLVNSTETRPYEVAISMEKLNRIEEVDVPGRSITAGAGVILEYIQNEAKRNDLLFPINFGAKGSAQIGGIISTNAGGLRVFRYGMTQDLVLGLEVVLADGTVLSSIKKIIKDNSGYDLKQLFIGSEGTLGIVTKAVLKLVEAPVSRNSAFVGFDNYEKVVDFLKFMDKGLAGTLSAFEVIWNIAYRGFTSPSSVKAPLPDHYKYYVLLESLGSNQHKDHEALQQLLESAFQQDMILEAVMAHSQSDLNWFWNLREEVHVINSPLQYDQQFDVSLPIGDIGKYVDDVCNQLNEMDDIEVCYPFGHIADGNIHFVLGKKNDSRELTDRVNAIVYEPLKTLGGSASAEHGIGYDKKAFIGISKSPEEIMIMKRIKRCLDPQGLLNRNKIFDWD